MYNEIDLNGYKSAALYSLGEDFSGSSGNGDVISFNNYYMEKSGKPFFAVSGEFHYSRMDESRWEDEIIKMRLGGVNIISSYLFWNHIEEEEGVFDFSGRRNLRRFVQLCAKHGLYVILRVGPFDHGEVRNGGLPDWLYAKPYEVRHTNEGFMQAVKQLYAKIGEQVQGLFYKDNGPIIGVQLDNEYMHSSAVWEMTTGISDEWIFSGNEGETYILKLRELALEAGLTPVFFTGTAWGGAAYSPRVMPLWGGYAYRPWIFYSHKGEHPATEEFIYEDYHHDGAVCMDDFAPAYAPEERPYACCEMGAGMMCCYYYRFIYPYKSVDALANIKLASGCNFIGYYMFQGGTNPLGKHGAYLNESQVPKLSYDYQAALGEFGQVRESYQRLKSIHYFTQCFGDRLAPMETVLPKGASQIQPTDLTTLRWAVRTDGRSGFVFLCNFQDHLTMPAKEHEEIVVRAAGETYRYDISIASEENAILPFHMELDGILLRQANAQPVLRTSIGNRSVYVFMIPDGMMGSFRFEKDAAVLGGNGTKAADTDVLLNGMDCTLFTVKKADTAIDILAVSRSLANEMYVLRSGALVFTPDALLEDEQGGLKLETVHAESTIRTFPAGLLKGSRAAVMADEGILGVYRVQAQEKVIPVRVTSPAPRRFLLELQPDALDAVKDARLRIDYRGDIGHLFLGGVMISDNFYNGSTWEVGLKEHRNRLKDPLLLTISPIREGARVNVESTMAARNEEVDTMTAELVQVTAQPVYEISL